MIPIKNRIALTIKSFVLKDIITGQLRFTLLHSLLEHITLPTAIHTCAIVVASDNNGLAHNHALTVRIFNIFAQNALLLATQQNHFGSTISEEV